MWDTGRLKLFTFLLTSGYLISCSYSANLTINPSNNPLNAPAGRGFALTCLKKADQPELFSEMKWMGPRGEIGDGTSNIMQQTTDDGLSLIFQNPTIQDSGQYNCTAWYDNTIKLDKGVQLIFFQDVTWDDCPEKQALVINQDSKIRCRVSANPPASILWVKDGQPLTDRYVVENDGIKVIRIAEEDKGEYTLRAMVQQTGLFHNRIIKVEVHVPPEIIELQDRFEATEGSEAILSCQASGFPRPTYSWLDPDQRNLTLVEGYIVDSDTGTLTILNVKRQNKGSYTCIAKNPAGDITKSLDLLVLVKPEVTDFKNQTTVEGQSVTFECRAVGDPMPELSIRKEGQDRGAFDMDEDRIEMTKKTSGNEAVVVMAIQNTLRSDDGLYYCSAENKAGHSERVGHLTVEFAPVMGSTPSTSSKTWNNNPVNITCKAEAIPNATITWSFQGRKIQDDALYKIHGRSAISNLEVHPTSDSVYGIYKCEADNPHGQQFINIELQKARVPGMVRDLRTVKVTATTVTFAIDPPLDDGGMPLRSYAVKFYEEGSNPQDALLEQWNEGGPYTQEKLRPRATYRFKVAATNEVGAGEYSDERRVVMPAESAPESPKFVTPGGNVSTYSDRFQIRWTVPEDNGRKIAYFELRYFEAKKKNGVWHRVSDPIVKNIENWENSPQHEMTGLKPNTFYKVEVRAKNVIGYSQDATMVFQTAADPSKGSEHNHPSDGYYSQTSSSLSTGAILAIIAAILLIVLIIVDITCYVRYHWGLVFFLRSRVCAKPANEKAKEAAFEEGKGTNDPNPNNGNVKIDINSTESTEKGDNFEKKSRSEVDNPAFDAKDAKPNDSIPDDMKNKSPKGSKSSIAKDSLV